MRWDRKERRLEGRWRRCSSWCGFGRWTEGLGSAAHLLEEKRREREGSQITTQTRDKL